MECWKMNGFSCSFNIASVLIARIRLVCMISIIIMYLMMIAMDWIPEYLDFISKYTFKDFNKHVPFGFENFSLGVICIRSVLCTILLLGIHFKSPKHILPSLIYELSIFITLTVICTMFSSFYNLDMGNWILGLSQLLIGCTYVAYLIIALCILFKNYCDIRNATCMEEQSANSQSECIELTTRN